MATIKIRNQSTVNSERPAERRELILDFKDDNIILKSTDEKKTTNPSELKIINEGVFLKKDEIADWAKQDLPPSFPKLSQLPKEENDDLLKLLEENPLEFAYEVAKKQGYNNIGSKAEWMEKCGIESLVPINDIYNVFKTYWNANSFVYTSMTESGKTTSGGSDIDKAGRRNAMWFGKSGDSNIPIQMYQFTKGSSTKEGFPINCSSLAALVTLGIPYDKSRYTQNSKVNYELSDCTGGYTFNMYGDDSIIDITNYNTYFKADRQLSRCRELGLEIPALHLEWTPKAFIKANKPLTSWYDVISPNSDLREAKPGDLIFWNNDGNSESDPRVVSHVVLVLARLSYDSRNPNQPLLLLAEATAASDEGVQICYYMYDDNSEVEFLKHTRTFNGPGCYIEEEEEDITIPAKDKMYEDEAEYLKIKTEQLEELKNYLYLKSNDDIYKKSKNGNYLRLITGEYIKIYNDLYIPNNDNVSRARYQTNGTTQNDNGVTLKCGTSSKNKIFNFTTEKTFYKVSDSSEKQEQTVVITYSQEKVEGTNEHKIPKFICRPKYKRLQLEPYVDISKPIESADYGISKDTRKDQKIITFTNTDKELYTLEFNWKPCKQTTDTPPKPITEQKLVILNDSDKELLFYTLPDIQGGDTYKRIRLIIPTNSQISTSKKNKIGKIGKKIRIQEQGKVENSKVSRVPEISDIKIYKGIRLT